ncbi:hypothetical protein BJ508DRAFT_18551 [Ascobolus immersus RN42]|uniref:Uncharacterized protein n=1 Tax=Ascobolus immersus RN42 TaxID=1160509 RepID=A0A3N4HUI7_ASCIM|nr:hypothetical protein BJ508DRAFT_18551 [Ascobolus immersus RN42]
MSSPHNVALKDIIKPDITDTSQSLELHWSQQMKEKTSRFLVGRFRNITKDGQAGIIFVEHIMLHEYQKLLSTDGTITVTSSFQYGDKTPATRWLVYQNKQNKMFQVDDSFTIPFPAHGSMVLSRLIHQE